MCLCLPCAASRAAIAVVAKEGVTLQMVRIATNSFEVPRDLFLRFVSLAQALFRLGACHIAGKARVRSAMAQYRAGKVGGLGWYHR